MKRINPNAKKIDIISIFNLICILANSDLESISNDINSHDFYWWMDDLMKFEKNDKEVG